MTTNVLQVERIEKYYGRKHRITKALDNLSFNVQVGEFIGIMGPSGSGKTTLLNCLATIDTVTTGKILVAGQDITQFNVTQLEQFRQNELGFIFQDYNLLDTLTGAENIALALVIQGVEKIKIASLVEAVAKTLKITEVLDKYPYEMSGGQMQRVAVARALVKNPQIILADEPTGALDSRSARILLEQLVQLNREQAASIVMVTHDSVSASYCQRILFIKDGKVFTELVRGNDTRQVFFKRILEVMAVLGGDFDA